ncbi:hypothetical protein [Puniceibacterium sp. IMCC21224]|uniref:nucleotide-binding protein n=1 Tax=Puniceibacterium sp. IMCC21224 TaxID=1618204 RepID=UPI001E57411B|nr:hypothetical protein [Puniceibacterium sp. IMCC21224]
MCPQFAQRRYGPERGSGKTTLSRALISAAVAAGRRVLLVDTDSTRILGACHAVDLGF